MSSFRFLLHYFLILGYVLLISPTRLNGQTEPKNKDSGREFPYSLEASKDLVLLPVGTSMFFMGGYKKINHLPMTSIEILSLDKNSLFLIDSKTIGNWNPRLNQIRESFEPASFIAGLGLIAYAGRQYLIQEGNTRPALTLLTMYAEGALLSEGMVWLSKTIIKRPRPYTYNSDLSIDFRAGSSTNNESFISGNATVLFYNATFISQVLTDLYPGKSWLPYVWTGSYGLAVLSGYWSVKSGMHFPTDVIAGAIWGSSMAFLVTHIHKKKTRKIKIVPWATTEGKGATLLLKLRP